MTQKEKELLMIDLCARLPYGVKIRIRNDYVRFQIEERELCAEHLANVSYNIENLSMRPYLRPMLSMTEEERKEVSVLLNYEFYIDNDYALIAEDDRHRITHDLIQIYTDYLNKKMFAYRTLDDKNMFELGLALEAPEGMYEIQN